MSLTVRRTVYAVSALALAASLAACGSAGPTPTSSADYASSPEMAVWDQAGSDSLSAAGFDASDGGMTGDEMGSNTVAESAVITTGDARVTADDPVAAAQDFTAKVTSLGGTIANSWQRASGDHPYVEVTARIPSPEFQGALDWLPELGDIEHLSTNAEDVTTQLTDVGARIAALETSVERLTDLIANAETTADLLAAEDMLTQRQARLDSLTATQEYLLDQVSLSTLTVAFSTDGRDPGPSLSWGDSWNSFLTSIYWLLNAVVFVLPWIGLIVVLVLVWRAVRALRRRRTAKRLSQPIVE